MRSPESSLARKATPALLGAMPITLLVHTLLLQAAQGLDADRWRWSNPLPHGNNVLDMLVTDDFAVQVGDAGSILVRRSDSHWVPALTGVTGVSARRDHARLANYRGGRRRENPVVRRQSCISTSNRSPHSRLV